MVRREGIRLFKFVQVGWAIVLLIALGTSNIFAQVATARIVGVIRDTSGALMPGVSINIKHLDSGYTRTTVSNETGSYTVPLLPVGPYEITTEMPGFKQGVRKGINLVV